MKRITIDDVEHPPTISPSSVLRPLSRPLGLTDVSINYFELAPGESFGFDYHRHLDQEEVFYVMAGTATFRTEDTEIEVNAGELVRFARGEFQLGRNAGEDWIRALAIGAPGETTEIEYLRPCGECGEETMQSPEVDRDAMVFEIRCDECESVVDRFEF